MKRLLVLMALAGAGAAFACSDDGEAPDMNGDDAGTADAAAQDSSMPLDSAVPRTVKVENVGGACALDAQCMGPEATCEVALGEGEDATALEGGYCTATCEVAEECGTSGGCPLAEIAEDFAFPGLDIASLLPIPSYCLDKCDSKDAAACRTGYVCQSIADAVPEELRNSPLGLVLRGPAWRTTYCMPPIEFGEPEPEPDAGAPDAGTTNAALVGGLDSGI